MSTSAVPPAGPAKMGGGASDRKRPAAAPMHAGLKICKIEIGKCLLFVTLLTSVCFQGARADEGDAGATPADPHPPPTNEPGKSSVPCWCMCLSFRLCDFFLCVAAPFRPVSPACLVFSLAWSKSTQMVIGSNSSSFRLTASDSDAVLGCYLSCVFVCFFSIRYCNLISFRLLFRVVGKLQKLSGKWVLASFVLAAVDQLGTHFYFYFYLRGLNEP